MARKKSRRRRAGPRYALKISGRIRRFRTKAAARKAMAHALKRGKKVRAHVAVAKGKRTTKRRRRKTTRRAKSRRTTRRKARRSSSRRRTTRRRSKGRRTTKRRRARKARRTTKRRRRAKGRRTTRRRARRTTRHGVKRRRAKGWRGRTKYAHPKREVFGFKSPNTGTYWSVTEDGDRYIVREQTAGGSTKRHRKLKSEAKALQVVWKWVGHSEPELKMAANKRRAMRRGRKTTRRVHHRRTTRRVKRRVTRRRGRRTTRRR